MKKFEIDPDRKIFRKYIPEAKFLNEVAMSQRAKLLSESTKLFRVPAILNIEKEQGFVDLELIENCKTFRQFYISNAKFGANKKQKDLLISHFSQLGKSLWQIHQEDMNDDLQKTSFPEGFFDERFANDHVFIHGDFTMRNILIDSEKNEPYIIDWSISPLFDFSANFGPRYWDLTFFISSLFLFSPSTLFSYKSKTEYAKAFLTAYIVEIDVDKAVFVRKLQQFLMEYNYYKLYDSKLKQRSLIKKVIQSYSIKKLYRFANDLDKIMT
ncbi:MAG: hypothetical protein CL663_01830 [Bacteroidetes bacterium]|nr:hypothetical protein [Bacteroidota bacterium]